MLKVKRRQPQCLLLHFAGTQTVGGDEDAQNVIGSDIALKVVPANILRNTIMVARDGRRGGKQEAASKERAKQILALPAAENL